jgi:hypothetical protein
LKKYRLRFKLAGKDKQGRLVVKCTSYPQETLGWYGVLGDVDIGVGWMDELSVHRNNKFHLYICTRRGASPDCPIFRVDEKHWKLFLEFILEFNQTYSNNTLDIDDGVEEMDT